MLSSKLVAESKPSSGDALTGGCSAPLRALSPHAGTNIARLVRALNGWPSLSRAAVPVSPAISLSTLDYLDTYSETGSEEETKHAIIIHPPHLAIINHPSNSPL